MSEKRLRVLTLLTAGALLVLTTGCGKRERPMPRVEVTTPTAAQSGNVIISYVLYDTESLPASINVQYSLDGGETYFAATEGPGGDGTTGLAANQRGIAHSFVWDSVADVGYANDDNVRISITATTRREGFSSTTANFTLENFQSGQWEPNIRVDDDTGETAAQSPRLAAAGASVYAVWTDYRSGDADIFFACSANEGTTWQAPILVNDDGGASTQEQPSVACDGAGTAYVVWTDYRNGEADIYLSSWSGGTTFSANTMVNPATALGEATEPVIALEGSTLYVAWTDTYNANSDIYFRRSSDGGVSWDAEIEVNDILTGDQYAPAIAVDGSGNVFLAWTDTRDGNADIYTAAGSDSGGVIAFGPDLRADDDTGTADATDPSIAVDSAAGATTIYVAYADTRNSDSDIFVATSADSAATFLTSVKASDDAGSAAQHDPAITVGSGSEVLLVFTDERIDGPSIYFTSSATSAVSFTPCVRIDNDFTGAVQSKPDIACGSRAFVIFTDARNTNDDIYFTRRPKD